MPVVDWDDQARKQKEFNKRKECALEIQADKRREGFRNEPSGLDAIVQQQIRKVKENLPCLKKK